MGVFLLIVGLILFIGLVVIHEMGHFLVARRNGVTAEEFGIFFPPRLYKKRIKSKKGDWDFTINLLPLGGFVRLKGEHDADTEAHTFGAASTWVKTKIMLAGVAVNLLAALVLFMALSWVGMPQLVPNQFAITSDTHTIFDNRQVGAYEVNKNSPAAQAGIRNGDQILAIGQAGHFAQIKTSDNLLETTQRYAGQKVIVKYRHDGKEKTTTATLNSDKAIALAAKHHKQMGHLGVVPDPTGYVLKRSTWSSPIVAVGTATQFTGLTFQGLGHALAGVGGIIAGAVSGNHAARESAQTQASSQVSGPVGIFYIMRASADIGYRFVVMIIAVISLTLAIMNVLPIPALDGGKVAVTYIARLFKKRASESVENWIYGTSFLLLIGLIVLISVVDVKRFF